VEPLKNIHKTKQSSL